MSLRGDLFARKPATAQVPIVLDRAAYDAAAQAVDEAAQVLAEEQGRGAWDLDAERARLAAARAALGEIPVRIVTLRALPPDVWDEMIEAHPPTEEQAGRGAQWNSKTHRLPCVAASVVTPDDEEPMTVEDWELLAKGGHITDGELNRLYEAAVVLNGRSPQVSTGKG